MLANDTSRLAAELSRRDNLVRTPLYYVSAKRSAPADLDRAPSLVVQSLDEGGNSVLHMADATGNWKLVRFESTVGKSAVWLTLKLYNATNDKHQLTQSVDDEGNLMLHIAASRPLCPMLQLSPSVAAELELLHPGTFSAYRTLVVPFSHNFASWMLYIVTMLEGFRCIVCCLDIYVLRQSKKSKHRLQQLV
jgi:hypothetical protein